MALPNFTFNGMAPRPTNCTCHRTFRSEISGSVIVYDNQTRSMLQTDQQFPSVSSQTKGLKVTTTVRLTFISAPKHPAGEETNWAQTVPGKSWNILLRLYGPEKALTGLCWAAVSELPLGAIVGPRCYRPASPVGAAF
jgi:Protein of unknown function (DUF1214)